MDRGYMLAYSPKDPYVRAFIVGIVNTLRVAVIGIVWRPSSDADGMPAVVELAAVAASRIYVELLREVPLLLQLLFWYVLMQASGRTPSHGSRSRVFFPTGLVLPWSERKQTSG